MDIKGYYVPYGYMGHIGNNQYMLFSTIEEYREYIKTLEKGED